jgi:hypothetical protein
VVKGLAKLHGLEDLQDRITITENEIMALATSMSNIILNIEISHTMTEVRPTQLPSYSGAISEDFFAFKDTFQTAATDNRIPRRNQVEKLRECLTDKAAANLPLGGPRDIKTAWHILQEAFGNPYASFSYRLSRIRGTPGLTDALVETDPTYTAAWLLDYENSVRSISCEQCL